MLYQSLARTIKTFYGVEFKPGEIHEVPGYINDPKFIRVKAAPKEPPKDNKSQQKPAAKVEPATTQKPVEKKEEDHGADSNK